jgi:hypothetical protein
MHHMRSTLTAYDDRAMRLHWAWVGHGWPLLHGIHDDDS